MARVLGMGSTLGQMFQEAFEERLRKKGADTKRYRLVGAFRCANPECTCLEVRFEDKEQQVYYSAVIPGSQALSADVILNAAVSLVPPGITAVDLEKEESNGV